MLVTQELMDDILIKRDDIFKRLVVVECNLENAKDYTRGGFYTVVSDGVQYTGAILKSKYKLRNGMTRLKYIVDERSRLQEN